MATKSTLTASNGTLGTSQILRINKASSNYTHTIKYSCGSKNNVTIVTKTTAAQVSWTPPLSLAYENTVGAAVSIEFTLDTYNGNNKVGYHRICIDCVMPASIKPSLSLSVGDQKGYLAKYGGYVQLQSQFSIINNASGSYNSTIKSYRTSANTYQYNQRTFVTGAIINSGSQTITSTITDTRGRTSTMSVTVNVLPYFYAKITNIKAERCNQNGSLNETGAYLKVTFSSSVTSLSSKNSATYKLKYKQLSATNYTEVALTAYNNNYAVNNGSYVFSAATNSSYNIYVFVTDDFGTSQSATVGKMSKKLITLRNGGTGIGIGMDPPQAGLNIGMDTYVNAGFDTKHQYPNANFYSSVSLDQPSADLRFGYGGYSANLGQTSICGKSINIISKGAIRLDGAEGGFTFRGRYLAANSVMWNGAWHMIDTQEAFFNVDATMFPTGIILVWSWYNGTAATNQYFHSFFIPRRMYEMFTPGEYKFKMTDNENWNIGFKYCYIDNISVRGHASNNVTKTTVHNQQIFNAKWVLRYVIGV